MNDAPEASKAFLASLDEVASRREVDLDPVRQLARDAIKDGEGEARRGLVGLNGAGLLAVISLLSQSLDPAIIHIAAALYFVGLLCGGLAWGARIASTTEIANIHLRMRKVVDGIKSHPLVQQGGPRTEDEAAAIHTFIDKTFDEALSKYKMSLASARVWTIAALAMFLSACILIMFDYEKLFVEARLSPPRPPAAIQAKPKPTTAQVRARP